MLGEEETKSFVRSSFRSVWALELICHLRRNPDQHHSPRELIAALRASEAVVLQCSSGLLAAGLIVLNEHGAIRYAPATPALDELTSAAEALYARSPNAVRRLIVERADPGLAAFANAFKLRDKE